jgi:hypothetical protein
MAKRMSLAAFERGYVDCALWCGVADVSADVVHLTEGDLTDAALQRLVYDAAAFEAANRALLDLANEAGQDDDRSGHDFWLTRNRHGAGFWDRGLGEIGKQLTDVAHAAGECALYLNDDGQVDIF